MAMMPPNSNAHPPAHPHPPPHPLTVSNNKNRTNRILVVVCIISLLVACAAIAIAVIALNKAGGSGGGEGSASSAASSSSSAANTAQNEANIRAMNTTLFTILNAIGVGDAVDASQTANFNALNTSLHSVETTHTANFNALNTNITSIQATLNTQTVDIIALSTSLQSAETTHTANINALNTSLRSAETTHTANFNALNTNVTSIQATLNTLVNTLSTVVVQNANILATMQAINQTQQGLIADINSLRSFRFSTSLCTGASTGWTSEYVSAVSKTLCRRTIESTGGCGSIFLNPGRTYSQVTGWVTLYQYGTPDAFSNTDSYTVQHMATRLQSGLGRHCFGTMQWE
jgi:hypothetical protein